MTPDIKVGNCLIEVQRYWIRGHSSRQAAGCEVAEQWNGEQGWADTQEMVSASKGDAGIVLRDPVWTALGPPVTLSSPRDSHRLLESDSAWLQRPLLQRSPTDAIRSYRGISINS